MKKKKMIILLILILIFIVIAPTYASFSYLNEGKLFSFLKTDTLKLHYEELTKKGHGISINDIFPVDSNEQEKENDNYFNFKITGHANEKNTIPVVITAMISDESDSSLGNIIDFYLTEVSKNGGETPTELFKNGLPKYNELSQYSNGPVDRERIIYTDLVETDNYEKMFRLRMWIDEMADISDYFQEGDKYFSITVNVYTDGGIYKTAMPVTSYSINFNNNSGTGTMKTQKLSKNETQKISKNEFVKEGYIFSRWNTEQDASGEDYFDEEEIINLGNTTLYAIWAPEDAVAESNGIYYSSISAALSKTDANLPTQKIYLLKDVKEEFIIDSSKNVTLNCLNHTIENINNTAKNVDITNKGNLNLINCNIKSSALAAAINNEKNANLVVEKTNISAVGDRQAIYNSGGNVEIKNGSNLSSTTSARSTLQNLSGGNAVISGGTIVSSKSSAINNSGTLTIGVDDQEINNDIPIIRGSTSAVSGNAFNFYDGTLMGKNEVLSNNNMVITNNDNISLKHGQQTIDNDNYKIIMATETKKYNISFDANGGTLIETKMTVIAGSSINNLPIPIKEMMSFDGWYTDLEDGIKIDENYIPDKDMNLYAKWEKEKEFQLVFSQDGPCTFNGLKNNITGNECLKYADKKYIDTGIYLFNSENYKNDFELYFEIDEYNPKVQESGSQQTLISAKNEVGEGIIVPGFALRRNGDNLSLAFSFDGNNKVEINRKYDEIKSLKISRINQKLYYSFNDETLKLLGDMSSFENTFDFPVTFGCALDKDKKEIRNVKATLSNMYIKIKK